nr:hypothetical protein [Tanacetum cinerariifolium]
MQNPAAFYDNTMSSHGLGNVRGHVVLDYKSSSVRLPFAEEDSGDFDIFLAGLLLDHVINSSRFLPDDRYDCLFHQSGSV